MGQTRSGPEPIMHRGPEYVRNASTEACRTHAPAVAEILERPGLGARIARQVPIAPHLPLASPTKNPEPPG